MTTNDFFLLLVAFGGFLVVPALLLWVVVRLSDGKPGETRGPGSPPDLETPDRSDERPTEVPRKSTHFSHRIAQFGKQSAFRLASLKPLPVAATMSRRCR
jgi:hypothetical protein